MKIKDIEEIKKRLKISVVIAVILLLTMSIVVMGANQLHWGFEDGEDLPTGEDRGVSYFVDSTRPNDLGTGLTWATAKKTIQAAVNLVTSGAGDYIYVKYGTYAETVQITDKSNFHIFGEHGKGEDYAPKVTQFQISVGAVGNVTESIEIAGFELDGSTGILFNFAQGGIRFARAMYIHDNVFDQNTIGIDLETVYTEEVWYHRGGDFIISDNYFEKCTTGIKIRNGFSRYMRIYGNIFTGCTRGIDIQSGTPLEYGLIENNIFTETQDTAIIMASSGHLNLITRNVFGFDGTRDLQKPLNDTSVSGNSYVDNHWTNWRGETPFVGNGTHNATGGDSDLFNGNESIVIDDAQTPTEGKVTVRINWNNLSWAIPGDTITCRLRDANGGLLDIVIYNYGVIMGPEDPLPQLEATLRGGEVFDVTVQINTMGSSDRWIIYWDILDAST